MDIVSPEKRSEMMSGIRDRDTKPEMIVRRRLHRLGFRYRLRKRELPGNPDLYLKKYNAVIFVHGCFFHRHLCKKFKWPGTNTEFWKSKLERNAERDREVRDQLSEMGIRWAVVWECQLQGIRNRRIEKTVTTLAEWLKSDEPSIEIGGET